MKLKELKKLPNLVLLNSEGNILTAYKTDNKFYMLDVNKKTIGVLTEAEIIAFTNGDSTLTSSEDEVLNYPTYSEGMRPKFDILNGFIYGY